jgi:hypothetical protein
MVFTFRAVEIDRITRAAYAAVQAVGILDPYFGATRARPGWDWRRSGRRGQP